MLCHIFKTGKHTDSNGNTKDWTIEDLDKICFQFQNVHSEVPICIGHPVSNTPAYGWVDDVKRIGENLYCSFKNVQDEFKKSVKQGLFKTRSISLDKDFNIRHIAFLGAQTPAIKGLEQFCFEDCEDIFYEEDYVQSGNYSSLPQKNYKNLEGNAAKKEIVVENENLVEQLGKKTDEISKLKAEIENLKREQKLKEFEDFANSAIKKGNILPKHKQGIIEILSLCSDADKMCFSDKEKSSTELVKEFISELKVMNFSDVALSEASNHKTVSQNAKEYAKELRKIMDEQKIDLASAFSVLKK